MSVTQDRLNKIRLFAERGRKNEEKYDQKPLSPEAFQPYKRKLDETIGGLQDHIKQQEDALRKLRTSKSTELPKPGMEPHARLPQIRRAKKAYDSLLQSEPELPATDSPLPVLMTLRETFRLIQESKASITSLMPSLSADRERLKIEESNLRDAKMVTAALEERIHRLQSERAGREKMDPLLIAKELVQQEVRKRDELDQATLKLKQELDHFIGQHLASMLAAEDSGGPTVGNVMAVPDETLEAGYTHHGRPKKAKSARPESSDPTQQRIEDLFRRQVDAHGTQNGTLLNKREAAAAEMHSLIDALLAAGSAYIHLPRESAASRFLIRAKIAQFHPRDARRIRLIDFGRTLGD